MERLIARISQGGPLSGIIPSFFFVDPFGFPITIPVMRKLLRLGKTELLVNLMWFRTHMHLHNPKSQAAIDALFGHADWRREPFMALDGREAERAFLDYFAKEIGAKYSLRFLVHYSPEDPVARPERRIKFYLVHFSNHQLAALLMKRIAHGFQAMGQTFGIAMFAPSRDLRAPGDWIPGSLGPFDG